jgi:alginate O-acetyltransferase complex protein AlgI
MLFNDPIFLFIFLPGIIVAYLIVYRQLGPRSVLVLLVMASIAFYAWWNPIYLPLLGGLAGFNFLLARWLISERHRPHSNKLGVLLTFGIGVDLAVLAYFKYTDFFINSANAALGLSMSLQHIVLPLGISFFVFQKIAYLVDASRGEVQQHGLLEYCFFVMFFPQLIAGPIVHHKEIFSQTRGRHAFAIHPSNLVVGITIFLIGLFKKVIIADHLAAAASPVFIGAAAGAPLECLQAWYGATAYAFQLYFDFSGYSDMAIGAARIFGIRLPINFNSPFQATSIIDFWQRWHMTLSRFLRDYIYIPLGGNRKGQPRRYLNLMLTMVIGGLWHGAAWNFVLWGLLHGLYLILNHAWSAVWKPVDTWWSRSIARLITMVAVIISLVTFRAPTFSASLHMYRAMANLPEDLSPFGPATSLARLGASVADAPTIGQLAHAGLCAVFWLAVLWLVPNTQQLMSRFRPAFNYDRGIWRLNPPLLQEIALLRPLLSWRPGAPGAVFLGVLAGLAYLSLQHVSEFLYFAF